jgi:hypothetical protein
MMDDANKEFTNFSLFNIDKVENSNQEKKNEIRETENNRVIINKNKDKIINKYMNINEKLIELTEIIYINNLDSVENFLKDSKNSNKSDNNEKKL